MKNLKTTESGIESKIMILGGTRWKMGTSLSIIHFVFKNKS